jgi:hypothetical protein
MANYNTHGTSISFNGLIFDEDPNGKQAHAQYIAKPSVTIAGLRDTGAAIFDIDVHYHWILRKANGGDIIDTGTLRSGVTNAVISENEEVNYKFAFNIWEKGDYELVCRAYLMTASGQCAFAEYVYAFNAIDATGDRVYFSDNGSSSNDGKDPLGLSLTGASYVESTGIITQTGKFSGVTLSNEVTPYNSNRWLYLANIDTYVQLESIIDNDSAKIKDDYKLGSDQTGLTSSSGAKSASDFNSVTLLNSADNNKRHFIDGSNGHEYARTSAYTAQGVNGQTGLFSYSGRAKVSSSNTSESVIYGRGSASGYIMFRNLTVSCVDIKTVGTQQPIHCIAGSNDWETRNKLFTDRLTTEKSGGLYMAISGTYTDAEGTHTRKKDLTHVDFSSHFDTSPSIFQTYTLAAGNLQNNTSIVVKEALDVALPSHSFVVIRDSQGEGLYFPSSFSGSTLTGLEADRDIKSYLKRDFEEDAVVEIMDRRSVGILSYCAHYGYKGTRWSGYGNLDAYDHAIYPSLKPSAFGDDNLVYMGHMRVLAPSKYWSFFINLNNDGAFKQVGSAYYDNGMDDGTVQGFLDAGTANNTIAQGSFAEMYVSSNAGDVGQRFIYQSVNESGLFIDNVGRKDSARAPYNGLISMEEGTSNSYDDNNEIVEAELWDGYDWNWTYLRNKGDGFRALRTDTSNETNYAPFYSKYYQKYLDVRDNQFRYAGTYSMIDIAKEQAYATGHTLVVDNNTFECDSNGTTPFVLDGVAMNMTDFNAATGGTNYHQPVTFDFDAALTPVSAGTPVLNFDASQQIYASFYDSVAELNYISYAFQCKLRIKFNTGLSDGVNNRQIFNGEDGQGFNANNVLCWFGTDNTLQFSTYALSAKIDDVTVADDADITAYLDNQPHQLEVLVQAGFRFGVIGVNAGGVQHFDGQLYDLEVLNASDDSLLVDFPMETVLLDGETATSGDIVMTYHNTTAQHWTTR